MQATAIKIARQLNAAGYPAFFAGGCVRDMVRGVTPHDFDIATAAPPAEVQRLFSKTIAVGARFGVVLVIEEDQQFEVATFRSDEAYVDGRRPSGVRFGTPAEDAQRRDFTINGLFYDPITERIIDYVGGQADIAARLVRGIGDCRARLAEDKLRSLRAVRFAANLDYELEPVTAAAIQELAGQIHVVSAERIRDELVKMFTRPHAGRALALLATTGLLREVLPEVAALQGCAQPPEFHPEGDVFTHVKLMLDALPASPSVVLAFAALLHDVGKPATLTVTDRIRFNEHDRVGALMTEEILRRLRFSNEQIAAIVTCVAEHMRMRHVQEMRPSKLKRVLARPTFADELELHRIDCLASHGSLANVDFLRRKAVELPAEIVQPKPLLTGHEIMALGVPAGPVVGQLLREVMELQLEEKLADHDAALAYARNRIAELTQGKQ